MKEQIEMMIKELEELALNIGGMATFYIERAIEQLKMALEEMKG